MRIKFYATALFASMLLCATALSINAAASTHARATASVSDESDVRATAERVFQRLRAGDYGSLYNSLASDSRRRLSRERFVSSLERTHGMYTLDRLEIAAVGVSGDAAAVDMVIYGRAHQPMEGEGKIVTRQYFTREDGEWRVVTTTAPLLAAHTDLARRFPPRQPRIYAQRDGRWVDMTGSLNAMRRRAGTN